MSNWYRSQHATSFFIVRDEWWYCDFLEDTSASRVVTYINMHPWATLVEVGIARESNGAIHLKISSNRRTERNLPAVLSQWTTRLGIRYTVDSTPGARYYPSYYLTFDSASQFTEFSRALAEINAGCEAEIFSSDIIEEFKILAAFCSRLHNCGTVQTDDYHTLPVLPARKVATREHGSEPPALLDLLKRSFRSTSETQRAADLKQVKFLLSQGEDLNKVYPTTSMVLLDFVEDMRIFELFLFYGADAFGRRPQLMYRSTLDVAFFQNNIPKLQVLTAALSPLQKPPPIRIQNLRIFINDGRLITQMDCSHADDPTQQVTTRLRTELTTAVDEEEEKAILLLCEEYFVMQDDPDKKKLRTAILNELYRGGTLIELIRDVDTGCILGFNIFEWMRIASSSAFCDALRVLYCSLSCSEPNIRSSGIIRFLLWRSAYLTGSTQVDAIGFLAIQAISFFLANGSFWPKFQPTHLRAVINDFQLALQLGAEVKYRDDLLACYVDQQLMLRPDPLPKQQTLQERVFYREFLDQPKLAGNDGNAAVVMFFVTKESHHRFQTHCDKMGISLSKHCEDLGLALETFKQSRKTFYALPNPRLGFRALPYERFLFWHNRYVESETILADTNLRRSNL